MLKEYQGINPIVVPLTLFLVLMGCIIFMNYLIGTIMNQVDYVLSQFKQEDEGSEKEH